MMKNNIIRNKFLFISNLILGIFLILTFRNDYFTFHLPDCDTKRIIFYFISKVMFVFGAFFSINYSFVFLRNLKKQNLQGFSFFLKAFISICGFYTFILLLIAPGNWNNIDEVIVFSYATDLQCWHTQGILTTLMTIFGLMLWPKAVFVIFLQVLLSSFLISKILLGIYEQLNNKKWILLFVLLFFTIPCIYYVLFPLRVWMFSLLLLMLVNKIIICFNKNNISNKDIVALVVLVALLCVYRTEIKFLFFIFPIIMFILLREHRANRVKKIISAEAVIIVVCVLFNMLQNFAGGQVLKSHRFEPYVTFLSMAVSNYDIAEDDINRLDKVIPTDDLIKYANYERPFEFKSTYRDENEFTDEQYNDCLRTIVKLIIEHPILFLKTKLVILSSSTGMHQYWLNKPLLQPEMTELFESCDDNVNRNMSYFYPFSPFTENISPYLSGCFVNINLYCFVWNFWLPILMMMVMLIGCIVKGVRKNIMYILVLLLVGIEFILVFLFAPATFQMYYFPFYLVGWYIIIYWILDKTKRIN